MAEQELIVHIGADIQAFQSAMNNVQTSMRNTANSVEGAMNGAEASVTQGTGVMAGAFRNLMGIMAGAFALDKIRDFGVQAIEAGANSEAMSAQFSAVFEDMEGQAQSSLSGIAQETGVLENRMKETFTKMASFAKVGGMDTADALSLSERAMVAVADSSAFYDKSLEETAESLQSFLKGNYENDAALGLSATETNRNAKANALYGKSFNDLSESQKQLTLLALVEDANAVSGALGMAKEESNSYSNQLGNLKQAFTDFSGELAKPFLKPLIKGFKSLSEKLKGVDVNAISGAIMSFGGYLKDVFVPVFDDLQTVFEGVGKAFEYFGGVELVNSLFEGFKNVLSWIKDNTEVVTAVLLGLGGAFLTFQILTGINTAIGIFNTLMVAMRTGTLMATLAQWGLNTALLANPFVWIAIAVGALIAIVVLLWKNWDSVSKWLSDSWTWIKEVASTVWGGIVSFFASCWEWIKTTAVNTWNGIINWLTNLWNGIVSTATGIFNGIVSFLSGIWTSIKTTATNAWNGFKTMISNIWEGIKSTIANKIENIKEKITGIWTKAKEIAGKIKDAFTNIFTGIKMPKFSVKGSLNPKNWATQGLPKLGISWHKEGGIFDSPSLIGIGEAGSEAVIPLNNKAHVRPFAQAVASLMPNTRTAGMDGNLNLTINVPLELDGREVARATVLFNQEELDKLQKKQHRLMGRYA